MRTRIVGLSCAVLLAASLAACGGSSGTDPLVGTYVVDVDRTFAGGAAPAVVGGRDPLKTMRDGLSLDAYRFDLEEGGAFRLTVGQGDGALVIGGQWARTESGIALSTTSANGETPSTEDKGVGPDACRVDGARLVLVSDGREIFLRKL